MGACCDLFERHEIYTNESRLKMLQTKVQVSFSTPHDRSFTYFLPFFTQHAYLEKTLKQYRQTVQLTQDPTSYEFDQPKLEQELAVLEQYLRAVELPESLISLRIQKDIQTIHKQLSGTSNPLFPCMLKVQIQDYELVLGITALKLRKLTKQQGQQPQEENIMAGRTKHQPIYRELIFPSDKGSLQITTLPIESAVTIDVEDVMKQEVVCNVLRFQAKDQDFGFIAVRMQFVTGDSTYNAQRREKLKVMEKQMKVCLRKATRGSMSESISEHSHSHRDTFVSDHVSEYHNEYQA